MAIVQDSKLDNIRAFYIAAFDDIYGAGGKVAQEIYNTYVTEQPVDGTSLEMDFLSAMPIFRKWVGLKVQQAARGNSQRFPVADYEATIGIPLIDINGDKGNVVTRRLATWLSQDSNLKERVALQTLVSGNVTTTYDGVPFFSTAHPNGPLSGGVTTQSNTSTTTLSRTALVNARAAMRLFADENYEPFGIEPNVLMVGPNQETLAREIVQSELRTQGIDASQVLDGGTTVAAAAVDNIAGKYGIQVVVNPRLVGKSQNYWFLMDTTKMFKPIVVGVLRQPFPMDNASIFKNAPVALFSIEAQLAFGFGHWSTCFASIQ